MIIERQSSLEQGKQNSMNCTQPLGSHLHFLHGGMSFLDAIGCTARICALTLNLGIITALQKVAS